MQLVAYGAQDIYLTGNPQITFSKLSTVDTLISLWNLSNKHSMAMHLDSDGRCTATISRNGDLVHKMYFEHRHWIQRRTTNNE